MVATVATSALIARISSPKNYKEVLK